MENIKLDNKLINRFFELKKKTYQVCDATEKKEYQFIKGLISKYKPALLELKELPVPDDIVLDATPEEIDKIIPEVGKIEAAPKEDIRVGDVAMINDKNEAVKVNHVDKTKHNGLTNEERKILNSLNEHLSKLSEDERRIRFILRNKVRAYKIAQVNKQMESDNIELGDTLEELVWMVSIISKGLAPQLFKSVSAAGLDINEIKLMHTKARLLNDKING